MRLLRAGRLSLQMGVCGMDREEIIWVRFWLRLESIVGLILWSIFATVMGLWTNQHKVISGRGGAGSRAAVRIWK